MPVGCFRDGGGEPVSRIFDWAPPSKAHVRGGDPGLLLVGEGDQVVLLSRPQRLARDGLTIEETGRTPDGSAGIPAEDPALGMEYGGPETCDGNAEQLSRVRCRRDEVLNTCAAAIYLDQFADPEIILF